MINLPSPAQWKAVERIAGLTGRDPLPELKQDRFRHEPAKFEAAGLTPQPSELVRPPRVAECPLQLEALAAEVQLDAEGNFLVVQAKVLRVHAAPRIVDRELLTGKPPRCRSTSFAWTSSSSMPG